MHPAGIAIARQRAEEEKNELLARLDGQIEELTAFRGLLESAPDAHVIVNSEGRIVLVNAQTEAMFGYRQDELLGQPVEILFPARFEQVHFAHRQHYVANTHLRPMNIGLDLAGRRQDGSEFPVEVSLSSLKTKDDVLITSIIRDITERKRADKELRQRLQALSRQLLEVQEIERRHIAHELHDEIGQILTALTLILDMSSRLSAKAIRTSLNEAQTLVNELMERVDELALNLRPAMLDDLGLLPALLWHFERYTRQTRVQVTFKHRRLEGRRFAPGVETAAYRIVQEALTNVARYAGVSQVTVRLWADADTLDVQIEDQGVGFDPQVALAAGDSIGLSGMQKRAVLLGGQLRIESAPGAGVCLTAELPLQGST
jgi:PAS domain S-box-containing protein